MKVLITGGAGFIGHHLVEHILKNTDWKIIVLDKLTYASQGLDRLRDIEAFNEDRVQIIAADFSIPISEGVKKEIGDIDYLFHLGAETHVDNSITDPEPFVRSNVLGTMHILNFARECKSLKKMNYFSTDEVFGNAPDGVNFKEWDRYNSRNPYAAAKAGGEELCLAFHNTFKVPVFITHTMNVFGERQHPEKFIPMTVKKVLRGEKVIIHSHPDRKRAGSRFWIHARNVSAALLFLLDKAEPGDKYNIVGERELDNLTLARKIAKILGKPLNYEMVDFHSSRPGHDLRYALDGTKLKEMGFSIPMDFDTCLEKTIKWMINQKNAKWL